MLQKCLSTIEIPQGKNYRLLGSLKNVRVILLLFNVVLVFPPLSQTIQHGNLHVGAGSLIKICSECMAGMCLHTMQLISDRAVQSNYTYRGARYR